MDSSGSGGSAVNNPPPRQRHQSHTQKDVEDTDIAVQSLPPRKRLKSYTSKDDENEVVVQFMPPRKHHQSYTCTTAKDDDSNTIAIQSISKEKDDDDDDDDAASKTITTWKKLHEITLLKGILEYYKENGTYPFDNTNGMQKFYEDWIEKGGVYVDEDAFSNKMVELPERFFMNQERVYRRKMIEGWKDPLEGNIFDLSHMIWGRDNDDDEGGPSAS